MEEQDRIDFVLLWVDGNDPEWLAQRSEYSSEANGFTDSSTARYRDWDNLQYWFRGVEKFTPWVNRIHFVTWGHLPKWLNAKHPKLHIVNHKDFVPLEYLPVFSCNPLEINLHRIEGLSENFVYFNDDMFVVDKMGPEAFFIDGIPQDTAAFTALATDNLVGASCKLLAMHVINEHFIKHEMLKKNWRKWFSLKNGKVVIRTLLLTPWHFIPDIYDSHGPNAYTKTLFKKVWQEEPELMRQTCEHRFRNSTDVVQHMFKAWQLCSGEFMPRKTLCKGYGLFNDKEKIRDHIVNQRLPMICVNDENGFENFEQVKNELISWFDQILPEKSKFEL